MKIKPLGKDCSAAEAFEAFIQVIKALRNPDGGCPWDLKQTHESLKPYLVEECYEVLEAIEVGDDAELCKELGDVLLQSVLHAQVATDRGSFSITDVVRAVHDKMVHRHPHVFGDTSVSGAEEVLKNWEAIKRQEKGSVAKAPSQSRSAIAGIPRALPALIRAERLGEKAAQVGFDWNDINCIWEKIDEELTELKVELDHPNRADNTTRIQEELGDVLFVLAQLARKLNIHPEDALRGCCDRFTSRFESMEADATTPLSELNGAALELLWQKAKKGR